MTSDGKSLEDLVAFVEGRLIPAGLSVSTRERITENGKVIAEFDVTVRGKVGSTEFSWLIQCRDRPSEGPQGAEWIEQLVARRSRFQFNKVTAVSTTGFGAPASEYALREGIELREVRSLSADAFGDWLGLEFMEQTHQLAQVEHAGIFVSKMSARQVEEIRDAVGDDGRNLRLKAVDTGVICDPGGAFLGLAKENGWFNDMVPNGPKKTIAVRANYTNDKSHFVIETSEGDVRVDAIAFKGYLTVTSTLVPFAKKAEYVHTSDKAQISRYAAFEPVDVNGTPVAIELHRMEATGETHVVARPLKAQKG